MKRGISGGASPEGRLDRLLYRLDSEQYGLVVDGAICAEERGDRVGVDQMLADEEVEADVERGGAWGEGGLAGARFDKA